MKSILLIIAILYALTSYAKEGDAIPRRGASGPNQKPGPGEQIFNEAESKNQLLNPTRRPAQKTEQQLPTVPANQQQVKPVITKEEKPIEKPVEKPVVKPVENAEVRVLDFHIVCHSHLRDNTNTSKKGIQTVDENDLFVGYASKVFTSIFYTLEKAGERMFTLTDLRFFEKWWNLQNITVKNNLRKLVFEGRLAFANGLWMESETTCPASYHDLLDNAIAAHFFLSNTFGQDFYGSNFALAQGYSVPDPGLLFLLGYDAVFMEGSILDEEELAFRKKRNTMQYFQGDMLMHLIPKAEAPCNLDQESSQFTVKRHAEAHFLDQLAKINANPEQFIKCMIQYANQYNSSNQVLISAGADRAFKYSDIHFLFFEKVMKLINGRQLRVGNLMYQINMKFSTFDIFYKALIKATNTTLPVINETTSLSLYQVKRHYFSYTSSRPFLNYKLKGYYGFIPAVLSFYSLDIMRTAKQSSLHAVPLSQEVGYARPNPQSQKVLTEELIQHSVEVSAKAKYGKLPVKELSTDLIDGDWSLNAGIMSETMRLLAQSEQAIDIQELHTCKNEVLKNNFGQYQNTTSQAKASATQWCPGRMTAQSFLAKVDYIAIVYNPGVNRQNFTKINMQLAETDKTLVPNITVLEWDGKQQKFVGIFSENYCYPTVGQIKTSNHDALSKKPVLDCELYVYSPLPPFSYKILKVFYTEIPAAKVQDFQQERKQQVEQKAQQKSVEIYEHQKSIPTMDKRLPTFKGKVFMPEQVLDYAQLCLDLSLAIQNAKLSLRVKRCTSQLITFGIKFTDANKSASLSEEQDFDFDFRYYNPFHSNSLVPGGIYVFKTSDKDSTPYSHVLKSIKVFKGAKTSMLIIQYKNKAGPNTQVKIKLHQKARYLEFDVFFGHLDRKRYRYGQEVTINWSSHSLKSKSIFYTDANSYRFMMHNITQYKKNQQSEIDKIATVPSYFYPVNSGIFIEDDESHVQMAVMNDRPQAASAYHITETRSRIEFLFMRRGITSDQLGLSEPIEDYGQGGLPVNYTGKYYLTFTDNRTELYDLISQRHLSLMNREKVFFAQDYSVVNQVPLTRHSGFNESLKEFLSYLNDSRIQDIQLVPTIQNDLYLRLHRKVGPQLGNSSSPSKILNRLCLYQFKANCSSVIESLQKTRLDGQELQGDFDQQQGNFSQFEEAGGQVFTLETYKLNFKRD